ncbi:hypothetical protein HUJ04_008578 [Dendroctonus ponderosae]|nr:hypothetical protein HUJ04_008578 [Dendroctonus ponderosae]
MYVSIHASVVAFLYCTRFYVIAIVFYASDFAEYATLKVFNHEKVRYGCKRCKKTYQQKKTLGRHLRFDCGQKPAFVCQMCTKAFKHGYILLKHMRNIHDIYIKKLRQRQVEPVAPKPDKFDFKVVKKPPKLVLQVANDSCVKSEKDRNTPPRILNFDRDFFANADALRFCVNSIFLPRAGQMFLVVEHQWLNSVLVQQKYPCRCGRSYRTKTTLNRHRKYECGLKCVCGKAFNAELALKVHKRTCPKILNIFSLPILAQHYSSLKLNSTGKDISFFEHQPGFCLVSGSLAWKQLMLKKRISFYPLINKPLDSVLLAPSVAKRSKVKMKITEPRVAAIFACPKCGKIYHHKKTLSRHIRQECGIEPELKCPHCPYRARRAYVLNNHVKGHQYLYNSTWARNEIKPEKIYVENSTNSSF